MKLANHTLFGLTCLGVWLTADTSANWMAIAQGDSVWLPSAGTEQYQEFKPQLQRSFDRLREHNIAPVITSEITSEITRLPVVFAATDRNRFAKLAQTAIEQNFHQQSISDLMQTIATQFLGDPYAANLLDRSPQEQLVVTLHQFDCVLFVETVLALARSFAMEDYSEAGFIDHLQEQRYRNNELKPQWNSTVNDHLPDQGQNSRNDLGSEYCNRIHYFSEWIENNHRQQIVTDLGTNLSGRLLNKTLDFMSTHRQNYPQLINSEANYQCIIQVEDRLNAILNTKYIAKTDISVHYTELQPGDIIAIATAIPGLDVTHTGLVYRTTTGNIGLIHAAPNRGVIIAQDLQSYVENLEDAIGILVARPVDPR